ncbi:MAG: hypothetical protein J6Y26_05085, partial [Lachnospiraceae bacterium]|nr:hypothetical protein [Lachnospiraceae bacterium]
TTVKVTTTEAKATTAKVTTTSVTTTAPATTVVTTTTAGGPDVKIAKEDAFGGEVKGATLTLTGTDKSGDAIVFPAGSVELGEGAELVNGSGEKLVWISGNGATNVLNLRDGAYTLHEETAPTGFAVANDMTFEIEGGKIVKINGEEVAEGTVVVMIDEALAEVKINKADQFGAEVEGATLTLTGKDKNGEDVVFPAGSVELGEGAKLTAGEGKTLEWISGKESTNVKNFVDGTYTLHEEAAPNGYAVANDMTFEIERGKIVKVNGEEYTEGNVITVIDERLGDVKIAKKDAFGGEVKGATLTLTGTDKNGGAVIFPAGSVELGEGAELVNGSGESLAWISGKGTTNVLNLVDGTYTLHEETAPTGFAVAQDMTFEIQGNKIVKINGEEVAEGTVVEMIDEALAEVKISKQDASDHSELEGATMTLTGIDENGEAVEFPAGSVELGEGAKLNSGEGKTLEWVSGKENTEIKNLVDGTYTLSETAAPDGYEVATEITFVIDGGKLVKIGSESVAEGEDLIVMFDNAKVTTTTTVTTTETTTTTTTT